MLPYINYVIQASTNTHGPLHKTYGKDLFH